MSKGAAGEQYYLLLATAIVFVGVVGPASYEAVAPLVVLIAIAAVVLMASLIAARSVPPAVVLGFVILSGLALRITDPAWPGSDVLSATAEAIRTLAHGANPYAHFYTSTIPPGSPFVYLPGEIALYSIQVAIFGSLDAHDRWWGILTLLTIAAAAPLVGYGRAAVGAAIYAVFRMAIERSLDGSNDTGLAFLTLAGIALLAYASAAASRNETVAARRLHDASAVVLGWALATKALVWFVFPFLVLYVATARRPRFLTIAAGTFALFTVPFFVADPSAFVYSFQQMVAYHVTTYGLNIWTGLLDTRLPLFAQFIPPPTLLLLTLRVVTTVAVFWVLWRRATSLGIAVLQGAIALAGTLFIAEWSTSSYYAYLTAVVIGALPLLAQPAEADPS